MSIAARRSARCALAAVAVLAACLGLAQPGGADATSKPKSAASASFNYPNASQDTAIRAVEGQLIGHAVRGSTLQFVDFRLTDLSLAQLLVHAAGRGVHVQVLTDGSEPAQNCTASGEDCNSAWQTLNADLNATKDHKTWARTCDGIGRGHSTPVAHGGAGCLGQTIEHNKSLLASHTVYNGKAVRDVTVITSTNNTQSMYDRALNNGLLFLNQGSIFHDLQRYFVKMAAAYRSTGKTVRFATKQGEERATTSLAGHDISLWEFPRRSSDDPVKTWLDDISTAHQCSNVGGKSGPSHTTIDAAVLEISRRSDIIHALVKLRADGCKVSVLYAIISASDLKELKAGHVATRQLCTASTQQYPTLYVHDKYVLVSGTDKTLGSNRRIIYTGSENWTPANLTSIDNLAVRYVEPAGHSPLFDKYAANFSVIWSTAKKLQEAGSSCPEGSTDSRERAVSLTRPQEPTRAGWHARRRERRQRHS